MKKLIPIIALLVIVLAAAVPCTMWGIAEIEKQETAQIEAETQKMRVQIEADNAKLIRDIAWLGVLFLVVSSSSQYAVIFVLAWYGIGLGAQIKKLGEKTRVLMRRAK